MSKTFNVGIVGATGAVGQELIRLLGLRNFPVGELRLLASARSAGKAVEIEGTKHTVVESTPEAFAGLDLAFFAAGGSVTRALAKDAVEAGCVVIDKSSALRMDPAVPLVIPEINADQLARHKGIVANPNCSTTVMLMGLWPLHVAFGVKRVVVSTYQSVSGSGAAAVVELDSQVRASVAGKPIERRVYPHQIAFNCIPQVDTFGLDGYTGEETKMMNESRKIMALPNLKFSATCVRVPVVQAHSVSVSAEFDRPVNVIAAREAIEAFAGAELVDDVAKSGYPTPLDFTRKVKCGVGRVRLDTAFENGLSFWVSGDNLWKGAALNAIQVAETLIERDLLRVPRLAGALS